MRLGRCERDVRCGEVVRVMDPPMEPDPPSGVDGPRGDSWNEAAPAPPLPGCQRVLEKYSHPV